MSKIIEEENYMARKEKISWIRKEQKKKFEMERQIIRNVKQTLLDWNFGLGEEKSNKFMTITCVIKKWEQEFNRETDKTDKEKRFALFDDLNNFWNNDYKIGEATIEFMDFIAVRFLETAIDELYDGREHFEDREYNKTLTADFADKLDYIYYKQAEKEFIKTINKNNLEKKKKKRKRLVIID